jgi:hypothetical protein
MVISYKGHGGTSDYCLCDSSSTLSLSGTLLPGKDDLGYVDRLGVSHRLNTSPPDVGASTGKTFAGGQLILDPSRSPLDTVIEKGIEEASQERLPIAI